MKQLEPATVFPASIGIIGRMKALRTSKKLVHPKGKGPEQHPLHQSLPLLELIAWRSARHPLWAYSLRADTYNSRVLCTTPAVIFLLSSSLSWIIFEPWQALIATIGLTALFARKIIGRVQDIIMGKRLLTFKDINHASKILTPQLHPTTTTE